MAKVKLYIAHEDENRNDLPEVDLYLEKSQFGVSLMAEDNDGNEWFVVSISNNGTLVLHNNVDVDGLETSEDGTIIEESEDNF